MNALTDSLYNVYSDKKTTKELWESLDRKYKIEDAGVWDVCGGPFPRLQNGRFQDHGQSSRRTLGNPPLDTY